MFSWSLPNGNLLLEKRLLSEKEWRRMLNCLALFKDGLVTVEQMHAVDGAEFVAPTAECEDCGLPYGEFKLDMTLSDEQWFAIHPSGINGLLCARCIVARASNLENIVVVRTVLDDGTPNF